MQNFIGESAALITAACWTVTAMAFEAAGKRVGALSLNLIRLVIALAFLTVYGLIVHGRPFPEATSYQWFWLALSGVVGFVLGDLFLFRSFILIGARISMLIMALVPPITAFIGWLTLGEILSGMQFLGMGITLLGIFMVMFSKMGLKKGLSSEQAVIPGKGKLKPGPILLGSLLALGGAIGQATGLVLSKKGMQDMDPFSATQIRIIAGVVGFSLVITAFKRWKHLFASLRDIKAMKSMSLGAFTGPFLGVSFSLLAVQHTDTGVAATLMALTPVMIIPPAILINKEKIKATEIVGAIISVGGVALFFL